MDCSQACRRPKISVARLDSHGWFQEGNTLTRSHWLVNFASVLGGVSKLLQKSQYIHDISNAQLQYVVIKNYWQAVKNVFSEEWANYKKYLLLRNVGVWSLSFLGGAFIDRCMSNGKVEVQYFERYLRQVRHRFDWDKDAKGERAVSGMSGTEQPLLSLLPMGEELTDEAGDNLIRTIQDQLKAQL